ncbi:unnamed protein product [Medioppia subpectinata]|uniref:CWH43-like N-terminal domain-containing protein n=1 Tax=Medioppia subpectinata TaxID=1979941 RepID=A0A7R9PTH5_9ACAR|nr:unnamed protein product [Medioppia subpectinata]CAG2100460.1 unnamed protein product [Medioppia subpectinata]
MYLYHGHSVAIMQYVSDLGAISPEANIFTLCMAIEGVFVFAFAIIRYSIIKSYIQSNNNLNNNTDPKCDTNKVKQLNKWSTIITMISGLGIIVTGSFRTSEGLIIFAMHGMGATPIFLLTMLDMGLQSKVAFAQSRESCGRFRRYLAIVDACNFGNRDGWGLSVYNGHSVALMQYVSDLGAISPEANIFTLCMAIQGVNPNCDISKLGQLNKWSLITSMMVGVATLLTSSFRTSEALIVVIIHNISAFNLFSLTILDMGLQSGIAFMQSRNSLGRFRRSLAIVSTLVLLVVMISGLWSFLAYANLGEIIKIETRMNWTRAMPGYIQHVVSAYAELILVLLICPYILSFVAEFKEYSLSFNMGTKVISIV